jgi:hypothetical protein
VQLTGTNKRNLRSPKFKDENGIGAQCVPVKNVNLGVVRVSDGKNLNSFASSLMNGKQGRAIKANLQKRIYEK